MKGRLLMALSVLVVGLGACAPASRDSSEEPVPSTTMTPAAVVSDPVAKNPAVPEMSLETDVEGEPAGEGKGADSDDEVVTSDHNRSGTSHPEITIPSADLPDVAFDDAWPSQPKGAGTEPLIPPRPPGTDGPERPAGGERMTGLRDRK